MTVVVVMIIIIVIILLCSLHYTLFCPEYRMVKTSVLTVLVAWFGTVGIIRNSLTVGNATWDIQQSKEEVGKTR